MPDIHDDSSVQDDITIDSLINGKQFTDCCCCVFLFKILSDLTANMVHFVSRPYPPVVIDGEIDDHDRPYSLYGHLGMFVFVYRVICFCN